MSEGLDEPHGPSTCNYNKCTAIAPSASCPYLRDDLKIMDHKASMDDFLGIVEPVENTCTHDWLRAGSYYSHGAKTHLILHVFCSKCLDTQKRDIIA